MAQTDRPDNAARAADDNARSTAIELLKRHLAMRGMRKTAERLAVLDCVFDMAEHFTVAALHDAIEHTGFHVSRATVYNTVEMFCEAGLLRRRAFGSQTASYERTVGTPGHHHLVCARCGRVREVKDPGLEEMLAARRYSNFTPLYTDLYVYGVCSRCARRQRRGTASPSPHSNANKPTQLT